MRFKSSKSGGFQIFAASGINTISFGIQATATAKKGLLGFAVERVDPEKDERYVMPGFKVFPSVVPQPQAGQQVSTWDHPVQSFVWDDFTAKPGHDYEYVFHPLKGKPKNLDRSAPPVSIRVRTEPLFSSEEHDVFFNRGVASSQAYTRRFGTDSLDKLEKSDPAKHKEALEWLTRDLENAILRFIRNAKKGDTLLGCFYEFRFLPVAAELKTAIDRGVDLRLIVDAKENGKGDQAAFPREDNLKTLADAKIPKDRVVLRQARASNIQHNKFLVLLKGAKKRPAEVWTGSTNLSQGGFSGQTNVGHWVRNEDVAEQFRHYWELLKADPGGIAGDDAAASKKKNAAFRSAVEKLHDVPTVIEKIESGATATVFSPRSGLDVLNLYVSLVDSAQDVACITLAFGVNKAFKDQLLDHTPKGSLTFMLLEKEDRPNPRSKDPFVAINASQNVYKAWGSFIDDPVYQWARETNAGLIGLNHHVSYVHSKFLLMDPLGADPIVVTGSANFSEASTKENDENMLVIRGDRRVADIYFTEFNRLFNHYYFRAVAEATRRAGRSDAEGNLFLSEKAEDWTAKYAPGKLKAKRLDLYTRIQGFTEL